MHLIICEDENEAAVELSEFLGDHGITTSLVPNIESAQQEIVAAQVPICLITNMRMPGGSGTDLVQWLRSEAPPEKRLTPALLVSGDAADPSPEEGRRQDLFDLRLRKPLALQELLSALQDLGVIR